MVRGKAEIPFTRFGSPNRKAGVIGTGKCLPARRRCHNVSCVIHRRHFIRSLCAAVPVFSFDQLVLGLPLGVRFVNVAREAGLRAKTIFGGEKKNKFLTFPSSR